MFRCNVCVIVELGVFLICLDLRNNELQCEATPFPPPFSFKRNIEQ